MTKKGSDDEGAAGAEIVTAAFGAKNRARLLRAYFAEQPPVTAENAWQHVYRLLLWADQSNGLAHCYESDKSQPGKNWYARSLAFHDWASRALGVEPQQLAISIDWLFRHATEDLTNAVLKQAHARAVAAEKQRQPYADRNLPRPGEDRELVSIVKGVIGAHLSTEPSAEVWQQLVQRIRQYVSVENKRKNLVGEGFEDVLAEIIGRTAAASHYEIHTRRLLHELPGFNRESHGEKPNKVDLALVSRDGKRRTLVTVKWSLRADREKQFVQEYAEYVKAESSRQPFDYVFVTNEFDPARLMRACEILAGNSYMFTKVVHINTDALIATYGKKANAADDSQARVLRYIDERRLIGLGAWIEELIPR